MYSGDKGLQCPLSSNQVMLQKNFNKRLSNTQGIFMDWKLQSDIIHSFFTFSIYLLFIASLSSMEEVERVFFLMK